MKLFKLMATTAITTMAVAAMSVSASAALEATYTAPVGDAAGSIALSGIETTAEQKTLLVLNNDATNVVNTDIVQIDQDATLTSVAVGNLSAAIDKANQDLLDAYNAGEKNADTYAALTAAWTESTNYYVRVGGDGTIEKYTLEVDTTKTLPEAPTTPDEPEVPTVDKWGIGNVDLSGEAYQASLEEAVSYIDVSDAILLLYYLDGDESKFTNEEVLENINKLGDIDGNITDYENEYPDVTDVIGLLQFIEGEANDRNMATVNYYYPDGV